MEILKRNVNERQPSFPAPCVWGVGGGREGGGGGGGATHNRGQAPESEPRTRRDRRVTKASAGQLDWA